MAATTRPGRATILLQVLLSLTMALTAAIVLLGRGWVDPQPAAAATGGNLLVTGHDADYHCGDRQQCNFFVIAVNLVRANSPLPLLILTAGYDVKQDIVYALERGYGTGAVPPYVMKVPHAEFASTALVDGAGKPLYSAIVVVSDRTCGGCDLNHPVEGKGDTPDSDAINARKADIAAFFNAGGGILAFAGADHRSVYYNFLPLPATSVAVTKPFTFTPEGLALGFMEDIDNDCCETHNSFVLPPPGGPLKVAETDNQGFAETLFAQNVLIKDGGLVPAPAASPSPAPQPSPNPPFSPAPGTPPQACISPGQLAFGNQVIGSPSSDQTTFVTNCGGSPLTIGDTALGGQQPGDFAISSSCAGSTLQPGTSCGIRTTFTPSATGPRAATVTVASNGGSPALALSGIGVVAQPPFVLTLDPSGGCGVQVNPLPGPFSTPTTISLTPVPPPGYLFIGWESENGFAGWADPWTFLMNESHTITAYCVPIPTFPDYTPTVSYHRDPVTRLAALGIIRGYEDGRFGPGDRTLRAQMAALIARGMFWDDQDHGNTFPDRCFPGGCIDDNLWRNIGTLYFYNVARGYADGMYDPTGQVLHAQVISFITRGMVTNGFWVQRPADPTLYGGILNGTGHESDVATFLHYTRGVGGIPDYPEGGGFAAWDTPSARVWFSRAEWIALDSYFGSGWVP